MKKMFFQFLDNLFVINCNIMVEKTMLFRIVLILLIIIKVSCYELEPCLGQEYIEFSTSTNNSLAQKHFILGQLLI